MAVSSDWRKRWQLIQGTAICRRCGFRADVDESFAGDAPHECHESGKSLIELVHGTPITPRYAVQVCAHRGEELRTVQCDQCKLKVRLKVFACAVHGECTLGKQVEGLACCQECGDYQPSPSGR